MGILPILAKACIISLSLLVLSLAALKPTYNSEDVVVIGAPSLSGFEEVRNGVFRAVNTENESYSINMPIAVVSNSYYQIRYEVQELPHDKSLVTVDFYAPSYDNPEQEIRKDFGMNVLGKTQDLIFNSGNSPEVAHLRIFYSGSPGLEVKNIKINQIETWWIWMERALKVGILGAFIASAIVTIKLGWFKMCQIRANEIGASKIVVSEIAAVVALYFIAVLIRFSMYILTPYWGGDEYAYKSIAAGIWHFGHHGVLTDDMVSFSVDYPNLLYSYLISPSFLLGENFYIGIRIINSMLINLAIFPSYLIARKYLDQSPALVAAVLSIAIPFVNIGAFVVTEVLFFPLFLVSIWIAVESVERGRYFGWAVGFGLVAAVLMNVRLNAMVLLPAYFLSILWISLVQKKVPDILSCKYWFWAFIAFIFTYVGLKYLLDGKAIGSFGFYGRIAERSEGPVSIILNNTTGFFHLVIGHLTTLSIPYALPIALITISVIKSRDKLAIGREFINFLIIISVFSSALLFLALVFTIGVSPFDLGGLGRWHSRYYFYIYPLIIIACFVYADKMKIIPSSDNIAVVVVVIILMACNFYFIKMHDALRDPWFGSIADNMDVQWYRPAWFFYWIFVAATAALTWLWCKRSIYFYRALVCFMIIAAAVGNYGALRVAGAGQNIDSDTCGSISRNFLNQYPGRFVLVGDSRVNMIAVAFWNPYIPEKTLLYNNESKALGQAELGVTANYLVVNGEISVDAAYRQMISIGKCSIYKIQS
jgi:hypothetical protein